VVIVRYGLSPECTLYEAVRGTGARTVARMGRCADGTPSDRLLPTRLPCFCHQQKITPTRVTRVLVEGLLRDRWMHTEIDCIDEAWRRV